MRLVDYQRLIPVVLLAGFSLPLAAQVNPFAVNDGNIPDAAEYDGPLFQFNYHYPSILEAPRDMPWRASLDGMPLSKATAYEYVMALKQFVDDPMRMLVTQPEEWNRHPPTHWYSMLWAGEEIPTTGWEGREAIYGTYTGQIQSASVYADSGLTVDVRNHAAIYYNQTAAYALGQVWQACDPATTQCTPSLMAGEAQFPEGSVIIKAAAATATPEEWPVLKGAGTWQIYRRPLNQHGMVDDQPPMVTDVRVAIFDIIVKDSVAAPDTGWVFSTLVYDRDAEGDDAWDKMVPLGAMWGLDPTVDSAAHPQQPLAQTYVNPEAPAYSTVTLGYGGRLSGPFDIAVKYDVSVDGESVASLPSSSCMSCHGTVAYLPDSDQMTTFFYPAILPLNADEPMRMYPPGSEKWNAWFTNRLGDQVQTKEVGAIALDYSTFLEMVLMNYASQHQLSGEAYEPLWEAWRRRIQAFRH